MKTKDHYVKMALALYAINARLFIHMHEDVCDLNGDKLLIEKFKAFIGCMNDFSLEANLGVKFSMKVKS